MQFRLFGSTVVACCLTYGLSAQALSQTSAAGSTEYYAGTSVPLTLQTQHVLGFYGTKPYSTASLRKLPRRPSSPPSRRRTPAQKPFSRDQLRPAISPFLNIFRDDELESAPNYYAFVRPQMQQQEFARQQRLENQRLKRQVQTMSTGGGFSAGGNRSLPTTGHTTRFMNIGGYYGPRR